MRARGILFVGVLIAGVVVLINSCKDTGTTGPPPGAGQLGAAPGSIIIGPGESDTLTISGGAIPYSIAASPVTDPALVTVSLNGSTLVIGGVALPNGAGTTSVRVVDSSPSPGKEVTVPIVKNLSGTLKAVPSSVSVGAAGNSIVAISGGQAPYSIATLPNAALVSASLIDSSLTITGVTTASAAGSTSVRVVDSTPAPGKAVTVPVTKTYP